jgi:hypothetical protein
VWSLDIASNVWTIVGTAPSPVGAGGSISHVFNECDLAFSGGGTTDFFSTGGGFFCDTTPLASAPAPVGAGGGLATPLAVGGSPDDSVFALRGAGTTDFWHYSISDNAWTPRPAAPAPVGDGGALVQVGSVSRLIVVIDIRPGTFPNRVRLGHGQNLPVAILSSETFDASTVDPLTVTLANAPVRRRPNGRPMAALEDVNGDGRLDLMCQIEASELELTVSDSEAVLLGETLDGTLIRGEDFVEVSS